MERLGKGSFIDNGKRIGIDVFRIPSNNGLIGITNAGLPTGWLEKRQILCTPGHGLYEALYPDSTPNTHTLTRGEDVIGFAWIYKYGPDTVDGRPVENPYSSAAKVHLFGNDPEDILSINGRTQLTIHAETMNEAVNAMVKYIEDKYNCKAFSEWA